MKLLPHYKDPGQEPGMGRYSTKMARRLLNTMKRSRSRSFGLVLPLLCSIGIMIPDIPWLIGLCISSEAFSASRRKVLPNNGRTPCLPDWRIHFHRVFWPRYVMGPSWTTSWCCSLNILHEQRRELKRQGRIWESISWVTQMSSRTNNIWMIIYI